VKILVGIANYGTKNKGFLDTVLKEYRSMSYRIDIVVLSNIPKELGSDVEIRVGLPSKNPWSLPFAHRKLFAERSNDYDLFIYSEDDTLITERHIKAFLDVTRILPEHQIAGFLRYEVDTFGRKYYSTVHSHFHWVPGSVRQIGDHSFARFTNDHSACYLLTRKQLKLAIDSGGYLVEPHDERYDLLVSAATDPYTQCGLSKVICISNLQDFELHHLPDIYIGRLGLAEDEFHLQVEALLKSNGDPQGRLVSVETKLKQERWSKNYYEQCRKDLIELIPDSMEQVLSIGCGWGATEETLVKKGHKVVAIPLDSIIAVCAKAKGIDMTYPDFEKAYEALSSRRFDCIIFSEVLQHFADPVKILSKYTSLLADKGKIIISTPNFGNLKFSKVLASEGISTKKMKNFDKAGLHLTTPKMVKKWLAQSNLQLVHSIYSAEGRSRPLVPIMPKGLKDLVAEQYLVVARKLHCQV
jgi:2-polyprenyl-3-methyl-5-hydroxy-6-metoxy-1,4-benzoquinol methylase